jgi:polysaccharide biosynthesis protein PelE
MTKPPSSRALNRRIVSVLSIGLALFSLGLAGLAWGLPLWMPSWEPRIASMALFHALSCLILCASFHLHHESKHHIPFLVFVFCFSFFLPVLGHLGLFLGLYPGMGPGHEEGPTRIKTIHLERVHARTPLFTDRFDLGGFGKRLVHTEISLATRMRLLMVLSRRNTPFGNRILRELLRDPNDEIRLAAYSLLDRREKAVQGKLAEAEVTLGQTLRVADSSSAWIQLATQHWESTFLELAEGEMAQRHMHKALLALDRIQNGMIRDPFLLQLKVRILSRLGKLDQAQALLSNLPDHALPRRRLLAYQAELAFQSRRFAAVSHHLREMGPHTGHAALDKVRWFWLGKGEDHGA